VLYWILILPLYVMKHVGRKTKDAGGTDVTVMIRLQLGAASKHSVLNKESCMVRKGHVASRIRSSSQMCATSIVEVRSFLPVHIIEVAMTLMAIVLYIPSLIMPHKSITWRVMVQ